MAHSGREVQHVRYIWTPLHLKLNRDIRLGTDDHSVDALAGPVCQVDVCEGHYVMLYCTLALLHSCLLSVVFANNCIDDRIAGVSRAGQLHSVGVELIVQHRHLYCSFAAAIPNHRLGREAHEDIFLAAWVHGEARALRWEHKIIIADQIKQAGGGHDSIVANHQLLTTGAVHQDLGEGHQQVSTRCELRGLVKGNTRQCARAAQLECETLARVGRLGDCTCLCAFVIDLSEED